MKIKMCMTAHIKSLTSAHAELSRNETKYNYILFHFYFVVCVEVKLLTGLL